MRQAAGYTCYIADTIAGRILEAARIHLIDDAAAPPVSCIDLRLKINCFHLLLLHRTGQQTTHQVALHEEKHRQWHRYRNKCRGCENLPVTTTGTQ